MSVIEFIISCLKPVFEWLQALIGEKEETRTEPFNVSEYLRRREKLILELEEEKGVEHTFVLWWGLNGLKINDDGTLKWISKKTKEPESVPRIEFNFDSMCQATKSQIDELIARNACAQIQNCQKAQNAMLMNMAMPPAYMSYNHCNAYYSYMQGLQGCCQQWWW